MKFAGGAWPLWLGGAALGGGALYLLTRPKSTHEIVKPGGGGSTSEVFPVTSTPPVPVDPSLPSDTARAVDIASARETNPRNLYDFSMALLPSYPVAAATLSDRMQEVQKSGIAGAAWSTFFTLPGMLYAPLSASDKEKAYVQNYNSVLASVYDNTKVQVSRFTWGVGGPGPGLPVETITLREALQNIHDSDEAAKNAALAEKSFIEKAIGAVEAVGKVVVQYYAIGTKIVAPIVANIPGIGTVAAISMTVAADLALGESIEQAALDGVRAGLPGQPLSTVAFDAGVSAARSLSKGERFDGAALTAARDGALALLPEGARQAAGTALDTGMALVQGKDLQYAGFAALHGLARGNTAFEQGIDFADSVAQAAKTGQPVQDVLVKKVYDEVVKAVKPDDIEPTLAPLIEEIGKQPELSRLSPADLSARTGAPEPIAHAALATMQTLPIDKWMLDRLGIGPVTFSNPMTLSALVALNRKELQLGSSRIAQGLRTRAVNPALAFSSAAARASVVAKIKVPEAMLTKPGLLDAQSGVLRPAPLVPKEVERARWTKYYLGMLGTGRGSG